jgi:hypothetical protein
MIYMVDHVFADPATETAWHEWYAGYLRELVRVPGIESAQRFKAIGAAPPRFLAMYSVASAEVFSSAAYKAMGGGGSRSTRFHDAYRLWVRNLFETPGAGGADRAPASAPAVRQDQKLLVWDADDLPRSFVPGSAEASATWLEAIGLHMTTKYRAYLVVDAAEGDAAPAIRDSRLYSPFTQIITSRG